MAREEGSERVFNCKEWPWKEGITDEPCVLSGRAVCAEATVILLFLSVKFSVITGHTAGARAGGCIHSWEGSTGG